MIMVHFIDIDLEPNWLFNTDLRPIALEKSISAKYQSAPEAYTVTNDSYNMTKIWPFKVASSYHEADSAWGYGF